MNIKFLTIFFSLILIANPTFANENEEVPDFGLDEPADETIVEIKEVAETVPAENTDNVEAKAQNTEPQTDESEKARYEQEIVVEEIAPDEDVASAKKIEPTKEVASEEVADKSLQQQLDENKAQLSEYVKALKLKTSQLDAAKEISEDGRLRQMQLLQNIEQLKEQIKSLERKNLEKFKKILTPQQLETFNKLQSTYEEGLNLQDKLNKETEISSSAQ